MGAGHSHGSDDVDWSIWGTHPMLRWVLAAVVVLGLATIGGVVALWPSGDGAARAIQNADEIGVASDRFSATVAEVNDGPCTYSTPENPQECRSLVLQLNEGPDAGTLVVLNEINLTFERGVPDLSRGENIVVGYEATTNFYFYADRDRQGTLIWLTVAFVIVVVALGRARGVLALAAMIGTIIALVGFVAPSVLDGNSPVLVSLVAASAIAYLGLYLTHGFTPTTTVALAGTLGALVLTLAVSWIFFEAAVFSGLASDEALVLPFIAEGVNLQGLLLGGAMIGALGALDDVTVTQAATVAELRLRSPRLPTADLVTSGIRVGRDHIASTVNTLLLAYAGASMPLILLFAATDQSFATVANSELLAVEIVRTLCGSIGLVAAVPITTALAAAVHGPESDVHDHDHEHHHHRHHDHDESRLAPEPAPSAPPVVEAPLLPPATSAATETAPAPSWEDFAAPTE